MNKIKKILMLFVTIFMLGACEVPSDSSLVEDTSSSDVVLEDSSSSGTIEVDHYNKLPDWPDEHFDIGYSGDFLDIAVGRAFITGKEYDVTYSLGNKSPSNGDTVVSSNPDVFTVELVSDGHIKVKAIHAGQAKMRIIDSNEIIRWCGVVKVEDVIPLSYMEEYLVYDCEYWVSFAGYGDDFTITFNENGVFSISGRISNEPFGPITGEYKYVETVNNGKEYVYEFVETQDLATVGLIGFHVATNGTFMYLQDTAGTLAIMQPIQMVE